MAKVKYPLTPEAKEAARALVEAWDNRDIPQFFTIRKGLFYSATGFSEEIDEDFKLPVVDVLLELSEFKLITIKTETFEKEQKHQFSADSPVRYWNWHVLLMQELRNAVESDFEVSDFFLTTQAVGTIINAEEGSSVDIRALQSAASVFGDNQLTQINTPAELAGKLLQMLDPAILEENPDLAEAIRGLATVEEPKRKLQFGKVISQLGNSLQHTANTVVIIQALGILFQFLYSNKIL